MPAVRIKRIRFLNVSGFLLHTDQHMILVDTGHSKTISSFLSALDEMGKSPGDIDLIVLTHTHFDHAGGAAEIRRITGAPLAVHRSESLFLGRGRTPFPRGTRWKGKVMTTMGSLFARRMACYPAVQADLLIDEELDLTPYGIPGIVIHTPGHTAGSVSVILEDGGAIVGDNVLGISVKEHFPPFANDLRGVIKSWEMYIGRGVKTLYPAHGGSVDINEITDEIEAARKKYLRT